jgi:hypothetical protein
MEFMYATCARFMNPLNASRVISIPTNNDNSFTVISYAFPILSRTFQLCVHLGSILIYHLRTMQQLLPCSCKCRCIHMGHCLLGLIQGLLKSLLLSCTRSWGFVSGHKGIFLTKEPYQGQLEILGEGRCRFIDPKFHSKRQYGRQIVLWPFLFLQ